MDDISEPLFIFIFVSAERNQESIDLIELENLLNWKNAGTTYLIIWFHKLHLAIGEGFFLILRLSATIQPYPTRPKCSCVRKIQSLLARLSLLGHPKTSGGLSSCQTDPQGKVTIFVSLPETFKWMYIFGVNILYQSKLGHTYWFKVFFMFTMFYIVE